MSKKIVLFGAGGIGKRMIDDAKNQQIEIECCVDNDPLKHGTEYRGIMIYAPEYLRDLEGDVEVTITLTRESVRAKQILSQLSEMGFIYNKNVFYNIHGSELIAAKDKFLSERFNRFLPIRRGLSISEKYYVETSDGKHYFARIVDILRYKYIEKEFEMMQKMTPLNIPIPHPVELGKFGSCGGGYLLSEWIDGEELLDVLPSLTDKEQYELGLSAGENLKKIHSIPVNPPEEWVWCSYRTIQEFIIKYPNYVAQMTGVEKRIIEYIEKNKQLLKSEPVVFLHGDYRMRNMMIEDGQFKLIDFSDLSFGVPWIDMWGMFWDAHSSPYFVTGQLHGYFGRELATSYFPQITFYAAIYLIYVFFIRAASSPIARENQTKSSVAFLSWFDDMRNPVPSWYPSNITLER